MNENSYKLTFDRIVECDWCGEKKLSSVTRYGTTHYNRLICMDCAKAINERAKVFGFAQFDLDNCIVSATPWDCSEEEEEW